MDIQLIQQATSQLQKLAHSNNGKSEYEIAIAAPKVKDSTDEEVKQVLRFAMILIGIRAATLASMDAEEKQILVMFLKSKFGWFTLDEIKTAFTKACAGELDVDARPFENFTCEYIGRIMKAYKEWATEELIKVKSRKSSENYKKVEQYSSYESNGIELADIYYQEFLKGEFNFKYVTISCWDKIKDRFGVSFSKEKNTEIILEAKRICLLDNQEILETYTADTRMPYRSKAQQNIREINEVDEKHLLSVDAILYCCKRLGLLYWFKELKEQNVKSIFEYEKLQTN